MATKDNLKELLSARNSYYKETDDDSLSNRKSIASTLMEINHLRFMAAAEVCINNNTELFKKHIGRSVRLQISLIEGYDNGLGVSPSNVTMSSFYIGLDAFAAGHFELGKRYFDLIGNRQKEERRHDSKFIVSIGYAIKELVVNGQCGKLSLMEFKKRFSGPSYCGYPKVVEGIGLRDRSLI